MTLKELKEQVDKLMEDPSNHNLEVFTTEDHDYWGTLYNKTDYLNVGEDVRGEGPKKLGHKGVIIG